MSKFEDLKGLTIIDISGGVGEYEMVFTIEDKRKFMLHHHQECCGDVTIDDICGDLNDLLNTPILDAEESISDENPDDVKVECQDSFTWTFYKLDTSKGGVTIRWYGGSNGYYSESVEFDELLKNNNDF